MNYNFGVAKAYAMANYYDMEGADGYGLVFSVDVPVAGGTVMATAGYGEHNADDAAKEEEKYMAAVAYKYSLSKKTYVYGAVGYNHKEVAGVETEKRTTVMGGLVTNF